MQSLGTIIKKQSRDSMSQWSGYNDPIPYHAKKPRRGRKGWRERAKSIGIIVTSN